MKLLARAFQVLGAVAGEPAGVRVTELAARLGLAKSTTSRLLAALEEEGALTRSADNRFTIGPTIAQLVAKQPFHRTLSAAVHPYLQRLAAEVGEAAALCVPEGFQVLYLDQVQSQQAIQVQNWQGARFPMHVLSAGKLFLAFGPAPFRKAYLRQPLAQFTPQTINDPTALAAEIELVKGQGYALTIEEFAPELIALSVPLLDQAENCVAALNIFGPKFRLANRQRQREVVAAMRRVAAEIVLPR